MRSPSLVLLLALAGTALSGCASGFDEAYVSSAALADGPGGDGLSGDEPSGEDNGGDLPAGTGNTSIVFTDGSRVVDGSARTSLTLNTDPNDANQLTSATILVDPGQAIGFVGEQQLAIFEHKTTDPAVTPINRAGIEWLEPYAVEGSEYSEFRRISPSENIDVELQYWEFSGTESYVAHFRDAKNDQDSWFFGAANNASSRTTTDQIAALSGATLNYQGSYVGQAKTDAWGQASTYQSLDGEWRVQGHAAVSLDLASSQMTGTLTPQYWEKTESDGTLVQIDVHRQSGDEYVVLTTTAYDPGAPVAPIASPGDVVSFHRAEIELAGTISEDGSINGVAAVTDAGGGGWVNGDQALAGATYGAGAEQVNGVFGVYAVKPTPTGGDTGINDDRRPSIDLQGGFGASTSGTAIIPVPTP